MNYNVIALVEHVHEDRLFFNLIVILSKEQLQHTLDALPCIACAPLTPGFRRQRLLGASRI